MSEHAAPALTDALALLHTPRGVRPGPEARLPDGMLLLIRVVAGDEQALEFAQLSTGESGHVLREAAAFYIQQVMFAPGSHSYRVLGVESDASDERLRENYRWLVRWLHPDRNPDDWEAVYADRVNRAWQDLRTRERRLNYDEGRVDAPRLAAHTQPALSSRGARASFESGGRLGWNLRWLPSAIFVGLGVSAILTVSAFYMLRSAGPTPVASTEGPAQVTVVPAPEPEPERLAEPEPLAASAPDRETTAVVEPAPVAVPHRVPPVMEPPPRKRASNFAQTPASPVTRTSAVASPPLSEPAAMPAPDEHGAAVSYEQDANLVLGRFSRAYSEGNLAGLQAMFTADIRSSRGGQRSILADYNRLFETSRERTLVLHDVSWFSSGEGFTIIASYNATVIGGSSRRPRSTRGDIRFDLRRVNEEWLIYRLQHDERSS